HRSAVCVGKPSPTTAAHVSGDLGSRIAGVVDGGATCAVGLESTVVECVAAPAQAGAQPNSVANHVMILRPGGVTLEALEEVAGKGNVFVDPALVAHLPPVPKQGLAAVGKQDAAAAAPRAASDATVLADADADDSDDFARLLSGCS